jgi:hypothetical protein
MAVRTQAEEHGFVQNPRCRCQAKCSGQGSRTSIFVVLVDWQSVRPGLRRSPLGVHLLPPPVGFFLVFVFFKFQEEREAGDTEHDADDDHRAEAYPHAEHDQHRDDGHQDQKVPSPELKAKIAEPVQPLFDDFAIAIGLELAVNCVDVDCRAVNLDRRGSAALFGCDQLGIERFEFEVCVVIIIRTGGARRIHLVAIEIVVRHGCG